MFRKRLPHSIQGLGQVSLSLVPDGDVSHELLRPRGELELVGEVEHGVDVLQELETADHLGLDLVRTAEDVGVVLLEPDRRPEIRKVNQRFETK